MESDIIFPRDLLHTLVNQNPLERDSLPECLRDMPCKREQYGEEILQVLMKVEGD